MIKACGLVLTVFCLVHAQERVHHYSTTPTLHFLLIGDVGDIDEPVNLKRNLDAMNKFIGDQKDEGIEYEFQIELGDNLYSEGMTDVDDPRFDTLMDYFY